MKRYAVLFVQALIGYLIVANFAVPYVTAQTFFPASTEDQASDDTPETSDPALEASTEIPAAQTETPSPDAVSRVQYGVASWYGRPFHGRATASGEQYDMMQVTAAHRHAPLGTQAIVTNLDNGNAIKVRINDRGPFKRNRVMDLSYGAAQRLDMVRAGSARVKVEFLANARAAAREAVETSKDQEESGATAIQAKLFEPDGAVSERRHTVSYTVQAGSFLQHHNAVLMQKALMAYYQGVWIHSLDDGQYLWHRVRVGPFANREEAERAARHLVLQGFGMGQVMLQ